MKRKRLSKSLHKCQDLPVSFPNMVPRKPIKDCKIPLQKYLPIQEKRHIQSDCLLGVLVVKRQAAFSIQ